MLRKSEGGQKKTGRTGPDRSYIPGRWIWMPSSRCGKQWKISSRGNTMELSVFEIPDTASLSSVMGRKLYPAQVSGACT